jgi:hypothetical protein
MDAFYERVIVRAATIDELLSADFEPLPGQKGDADLAARRLAGPEGRRRPRGAPPCGVVPVVRERRLVAV